MNERIQELADKIWAEEYWDNPNTDKLLPAQLNKFAELIVRECVGVAVDNGCGDFVDIEHLLLKHFGVEE